MTKLNLDIYKVITSVPGIATFANLDFAAREIDLPLRSYTKGFAFRKIVDQNHFELAIIVMRNTRVKTICKELVGQLVSLFKTNKINCDKIDIYIRGVS
ncbi:MULTISPECIES: hypothetical protein [unclassified Mycoplasma]|uniref:hypothetical protein n=1 Tax=unclassified Mycoplasma TaxID=2683645 RepID=UPI000FDE31B3